MKASLKRRIGTKLVFEFEKLDGNGAENKRQAMKYRRIINSTFSPYFRAKEGRLRSTILEHTQRIMIYGGKTSSKKRVNYSNRKELNLRWIVSSLFKDRELPVTVLHSDFQYSDTRHRNSPNELGNAIESNLSQLYQHFVSVFTSSCPDHLVINLGTNFVSQNDLEENTKPTNAQTWSKPENWILIAMLARRIEKTLFQGKRIPIHILIPSNYDFNSYNPDRTSDLQLNNYQDFKNICDDLNIRCTQFNCDVAESNNAIESLKTQTTLLAKCIFESLQGMILPEVSPAEELAFQMKEAEMKELSMCEVDEPGENWQLYNLPGLVNTGKNRTIMENKRVLQQIKDTYFEFQRISIAIEVSDEESEAIVIAPAVASLPIVAPTVILPTEHGLEPLDLSKMDEADVIEFHPRISVLPDTQVPDVSSVAGQEEIPFDRDTYGVAKVMDFLKVVQTTLPQDVFDALAFTARKLGQVDANELKSTQIDILMILAPYKEFVALFQSIVSLFSQTPL